MNRLLVVLTLLLSSAGGAAQEESITFYGWSDQHVKTDGDASHVVPFIDAMNAMEGTAWPEKIGGKVAKPAFVIGAGDVTEWPTTAAMKAYDRLLTERLKIKAYDVLGNHDDGGKSPSDTMKKWAIRRHGGLSYSFDAGGVHFLLVWSEYDHDANAPAQPLTAESLDTVQKDLKKLPEGTPVVIVTHLCYDAMTNRDDLVEAVKGANVILILGGHYHKATVHRYKGLNFVQLPSPKSKWTEFTVLRITKDRLLALPYDFKKKSWATEPRKTLDVAIKGPGE